MRLTIETANPEEERKKEIGLLVDAIESGEIALQTPLELDDTIKIAESILKYFEKREAQEIKAITQMILKSQEMKPPHAA